MEDAIFNKIVPKEETEDDEALDCGWEQLTDMEAAVLVLLHCGYSQSEIARHFEYSPQRISLQKFSAIKKIRSYLEDK